MTTLPPPPPSFRPWLLSLAVAAVAAAATPAAAQSTMPEAAAPDAVIVTRTRDRTVLSSTSPIDVLHADDLRRAAGADGSLAAAL